MSAKFLSEVSYEFSSKIKEILTHLSTLYGVDRFFYTLYIPEKGKACFLSSEAILVEKIQNLAQFSEAHDNVLSTVEEGGTGKFIWPQDPGPKNGIGSMLKASGIKTGMSLLHRQTDGYVKNIGFASTEHSDEIINTILNKQEIFNHFITYFESEAAELIEKIKQNFVDFNMNIKEDLLDLDLKERKSCVESMKIKKLFIPTADNSTSPYLTTREFQCLSLLCKGQSLKQIAMALNLSPRTVESYVQVCKSKLKVFNKFSLIEKAKKLNVPELCVV